MLKATFVYTHATDISYWYILQLYYMRTHFLNSRWFGVRIDIISTMFVSIIVFVAVTIAVYDESSCELQANGRSSE